MELAHSLLLNEDAYNSLKEQERPVFIFEWLRFLDKVLVAAHKSDIKEKQACLVQQLVMQLRNYPGPSTRRLLASCLATLFSVGDTLALFETINTCHDLVRSKDDSPSYLPTRLAAVACLGAMHERLGRMVGRSFEETVNLLTKSIKQAESQGRTEIMLTLEKVVQGLGSAGSSCHKEIFKTVKTCITDRSMAVRAAAARCLDVLVRYASFLYGSDLEAVTNLCFRALDGSNYDVRCSIARLLGSLFAHALSPSGPLPPANQQSKQRRATLDEVFHLLSSGFLRRSSGTEMIRSGSSQINRELRVGVTHAYVELARCMGSRWLERNLGTFIRAVLSLLTSPRAAQMHVDAVYARKCVQFVLRTVFRSQLSDKAQLAAGRELCTIVLQSVIVLAPQVGTESTTSNNHSTASTSVVNGGGNASSVQQQHDLGANAEAVVCALHELATLVGRLSTSASPLLEEARIVEAACAALLNSNRSVSLAAAWTLRCLAVALPGQLTPLVDRCLERLQTLRAAPEAVAGYSYALCSLLAASGGGPLGLPAARGRQIFTLAEELLRSAAQSSRLSLQRTQAGWLLMSAFMRLGGAAVRSHLPRFMLLWRNAFPRSSRELEAENSRGDPFTWQVTLEARAGALCAMQSLLEHCIELVTEDVLRRLMPTLESALAMLSGMQTIIRNYGVPLKGPAGMCRLRLYHVLLLLPAESYEGAYNVLLRELVAEFTLTESSGNTTTSLLRALCHADDSVILGSWLQETDHKAIEDQLQPNSANGSGALEHDAASLFLKHELDKDCPIPGPLPLGVSVIDASVQLFGRVFPRVATKHRLQMLEHFGECIRQAKSARQQAVQINIFTAFLCAMKRLCELKATFGEGDIRKAAVNLIFGSLGSSNPILRCAGGECLGRMAQVVGEAPFIGEMTQHAFDRLQSANQRELEVQTGYSLALGCLHRYVGGIGSGQHLDNSVKVMMALGGKLACPVGQVWALHALALIAGSGGPLFRQYVMNSLGLVLHLLLQVPPSCVDIHQCLGKLLGALITALGPELHANSNSIAVARLSSLICCAVMQSHSDSLVRAEAIGCLQQLHVFAPRHVNLASLVRHLCDCLSSPHLLLRRAAVACLRQLAQREANEVCEHALQLASEMRQTAATQQSINMNYHMGSGAVLEHKASTALQLAENGLEGALFAMMDTETDEQLRSDLRDTLQSLLLSMATEHLGRWISLLKEVLQAGSDGDQAASGGSLVAVEKGVPSNLEDSSNDMTEEDEDDSFKTKDENRNRGANCSVAPRWPTRVFAIECLRRIIEVCVEEASENKASGQAHFDMRKARARFLLQEAGSRDSLIRHLNELIRMAFMAATSDSDQLRLAGLAALQDVIKHFASVNEEEMQEASVLEQYQAQISAALRPAFAADTSPDVTAAACEVCSSWIGAGVAKRLNDLRRVTQLLVSSLAKLRSGAAACSNKVLYAESAATMEKLAVLRAWADVYVIAMTQPDSNDLRDFVQAEMATLTSHWLAALRDHALLSLPAELSSQLPAEGGAFYHADCVEQSRPHYRKHWAPILHATSLWLQDQGFDATPANMQAEQVNSERLFLLLGIAVDALCSLVSLQPQHIVEQCLRTCVALLGRPWPRDALTRKPALAVELLNVVHRLFLTRDSAVVHLLAARLFERVLLASEERLRRLRDRTQQLQGEGSSVDEESARKAVYAAMGEGANDTKCLIPGESVVFAATEVLLCALLRYLPALHPGGSTGTVPATAERGSATPAVLEILLPATARLPFLCSSDAALSLLPSLLHLLSGAACEAAILAEGAESSLDAVLSAFSTLSRWPEEIAADERYAFNEEQCLQWRELCGSATLRLLAAANKKLAPFAAIRLIPRLLLSVSPNVLDQHQVASAAATALLDLWQSGSSVERTAVARTTTRLISRRESTADMVGKVGSVVAPLLFRQLLAAAQAPADTALLDMVLLRECLDGAEAALSAVAVKNRSGLLLLLMPCLVAMLHPSGGSSEQADVDERNLLHNLALSRISALASLYPADFKQCMTQTGVQLKPRLEAALKARRVEAPSSSTEASSIKLKSLEAGSAAAHLSKPTITLKMDFSNFSSTA